MLRHRDLLSLSVFLMNEILGLDDNHQLMDLVNYGSEWEDAMKKLTLTSYVSMNDPSLNQHVAKTILNKYMWSCPWNDLEKKILSIVCPFLKDSIFKIVDEVEKQLDDPEFMKNVETTTFDGQFIEIKNLLARWHEILKHAAQIQKTPTILKSLLEYLPSVVIKICSHCKNYRMKYLKRTLPLLLQDVYRDTCSIVKNYCALFPKTFEFNINKQTDLDALKMVIAGLGDMAPYTAYGMSTMIQTWKTFKYLACLRGALLMDRDYVNLVRGYFKAIAENINRLYKQLMNRPESEFMSRAKCSELLLGIFTDLHGSFCENMCPYEIGGDFVHDMIPVLIQFVGYYELCHGWNYDSSKCHRRDQIIKKCWPQKLLMFYSKTEHYLTEFRAQAEKMENNEDPDFALGFHYCLLHYEVFDEPERLDMALKNINHIQVEVMEQVTRWPEWGTATSGMAEACIYEYTLSLLCRACNFNRDGDSFGDYEDILLKHLLSERFWSALLAYDILIYCYTCSNGNIAFTHMQYFMTAYETLQERQDDSLAVTMLRRIIRDIYELYPEGEVPERLKVCNGPTSLLVILKPECNDDLHEKLLATYKKLSSNVSSSNLPGTIDNLEKQPNARNWNRFIDLLTVMGVEQKEQNEKWTENLIEIASITFETVRELEDMHQQQLMYDLILLLFDCARVQDEKRETCWFNWHLFVRLAEELLKTTDIPECVLIKLCHYLTRNLDCLIGQYDGSEATIIPAIFIYLLENQSQLVRQEALECFDKMAENANEDFIKIISNAIAKRPKLYEAVPAYLKRQPYPKLPNDDTMPPGWRDYLKLSSHFNDFAINHACHKDDVRIRNGKLRKLCEESLEERVIRLTNELVVLARDNINLVPAAAEKLKNVCRSIVES